VGRGEGAGRESRRRRVAPRLNDQIVLLISDVFKQDEGFERGVPRWAMEVGGMIMIAVQ